MIKQAKFTVDKKPVIVQFCLYSHSIMARQNGEFAEVKDPTIIAMNEGEQGYIFFCCNSEGEEISVNIKTEAQRDKVNEMSFWFANPAEHNSY